MDRRLILISAPAGFGKTTLVSEWVAEATCPVAWLSLDEGHNDPNCFLTYLVAALQTISPKLGEGALAALHAPQHPDLDSIMTILLNEIATVPDPFVLVLDDYHCVDAEAVDAALAILIEHQPAQMHLVLATREDPTLPLARLRGHGQLAELRAVDLRFTAEEAADFLNHVMNLNLSADEIAALETRTEGWIAGLQMAALSMQGLQDTAGFIRTFTGSHHFVMDYLIEEVLQRQSGNVQTFLLRTSILDRLCGPLCDAVLGEESAAGQETLAALQQANLFIVPLDNERRWYRYHHLLADLLRRRLPYSLALDGALSVAELHGCASLWYEDNDLTVEAFQHAVAAEDYTRAADLAELAWPAMDASLRSATWLRWVKTLPEDLIRHRPVLCVGYAWALLNGGDLEAGERRLKDVEQRLGTTPTKGKRSNVQQSEVVVVDQEQFRCLPASIALAHGYIAQALGDGSGTIQYAQQALGLLPEGDYLWRGSITGLLGCAYWSSGELEEAYRNFASSMESLKRIGNMTFALSVTMGLAGVRVAQGRLCDAKREWEQSLQLTAELNEPLQAVTAEMYLGLSLIHCERGELDTAKQHLLKSKELGEQAAFADWQYRWCLAQARIHEAQGDLDHAVDHLQKAERIYFKTPFPDLRPATAQKALFWMKQGRLAEALSWIQEQELSDHDDLTYLGEFKYLTMARIQIAECKHGSEDGSMRDVLGLLDRLLQAAEAGKRNGSVIEIGVLRALAYAGQDDIPKALTSLERPLTLAEPEAYVRIFTNEGLPMKELLIKMKDGNKRLRGYIQKLLATFEIGGLKSEGKSNLPLPSTAQLLIEPLSQREMEILHLIAQGLSNQAICERLYLALSTVKGHNQNIFGKLQVQRRTEAVARARELGLL